MRGTHGWAEVSAERKREIIDAIVGGTATRGPVHAELDLTDRCNVACYFCNQQSLRTKEQIPLPRLSDLIDEMAGNGLRSVRLSGGGDPLFHREILDVVDHLALRGVVVDNLTTNGVALTEEVARRLIANKGREVIFSLNAVNAADYARMMQVKPALFDKVLENIRRLVAMRGESIYPSVVAQFLIDRKNFRSLPEMYDLGRSLGVDRIALNAVLEVPQESFEENILLAPEDREAARPYVETVLERDRDAGLLQIDFAISGWNEMLNQARAKVDAPAQNSYPTAPAFKDENAGCFFAWYTAAITGNGDIRPCCLLLHPSMKPLGNIHQGTMTEHWNGPAFTKMRDEMREVLLRRNKIEYDEKRFEILKPACVKEGLCWLKNMYFRGDQEFYAELAAKLDETRKREVRFIGTPKQMKRAAEVYLHTHPRVRQTLSADWLHRAYDWARNSSRPLRATLKRRLGWNLTDAA
jgi:MoaA/NifB/PqqE/SkfB family radical SAM enzyme